MPLPHRWLVGDDNRMTWWKRPNVPCVSSRGSAVPLLKVLAAAAAAVGGVTRPQKKDCGMKC